MATDFHIGLAGYKNWSIFLKSFSFLFVITIVVAFLIYYLVRLIYHDDPHHTPIRVFLPYAGYNFREIEEHPFIYFSTIAFVFSLVGSLWIILIIPKCKRHTKIQIFMMPWIALILASPVWGVVWSVIRWPPNYFSTFYEDPLPVMLLFYRHDALEGLMVGWLSAIQSFPINILSYISACILLFVSKRLFLQTNR